MKRLTNTLRLVMFLMVAVATTVGASTGQVAAQQTPTAGASYISELSDMEVAASGDFEITDSELETYEQGEGELVYVESDDALLQVSFFDDSDDAETTLGLFNDGFASEMDDFKIIDEGTDGDIVWSVSSAMLDDVEFYHYLSVTPDVVGNVDVMTVIVSPTDTFFDSLEAAQDDVTLDGDGIFAEVSSTDLQEIILGGATVPNDGSNDTDTASDEATATSDEDTDTASDDSATSGGNVVVSEVTGLEIEVNDPWTVSESQVFDDAAQEEEALTIKSDVANGNIAFFVGDDAEESMNEFLDGFDSSAEERVNVDTDYSGGVAWSLDNAVLGDGTEVVVYTEVQEGIDPDYLVLVAVLATPEDFPDQFVSAQENITVDGEPVFADVDISDLEDLLSGGATDEDVTSTPGDETPVAEGSTGDIRRQNAKLPGGNTDDVDTGNQTETGQGGQDTGEIDFSDAGLISDTEYVSPQFDVEATWGDTWFIDYEDEESVTSDVEGEMDSLFLTWGGDDFALMFIDISTADDLTPDDFVTYWTSDDYLAENADADAEILLDRAQDESGAVFTRDYLSDGTEVLIIKEAVLLDDGENLAVITMIATPDLYADIYADAENDVEIGGGPALNTFTSRQIERAIDQ